MAMTSAQAVKELREVTGLGMMECKKLLVEAGNDLEQAKVAAAKQGQYRAKKLAERIAGEGTIGMYLHHDKKTGVLVEVNCNTDFVARGDEFQQLARDLAMQVAGVPPLVIHREQLSEEVVAKAKREFELENAAKPADEAAKIVEKAMATWFQNSVLMEQPFIKDPSKSIKQLIEEKIATTKENITVARYARFKVGETAAKPAQ